MLHSLAWAALLGILPLAGGIPQEPPPSCCTVRLRVRVPPETGTVFLAGSLAQLGPWRPDGLALTGRGRERTAQVLVAPGSIFEYKFTLGTWEQEALSAVAATPANYRMITSRDTLIMHEIAVFRTREMADAQRRAAAVALENHITDWRGSGAKGTLIYWRDVSSAFLGPRRHVEIWLPPGYDTAATQRYPVLYMHDGQNLFDPRIANTGVDWGVDEAIVSLVERGAIPPVIVVGAWSTAERSPEYNPWDRASDYARFLMDEVMPRVNREFRTLTGPENTAVMGSSMGGLLSFYLVSRYPGTFGVCGCLSTHFPLSEANVKETGGDTTPFIYRDMAAGFRIPAGTRYWFDYGTEGLDAAYGPTHDSLRTWLKGQGLVEDRDFVVRRYQGANHSEYSWRARLEDPLTFMFGKRSTPVNMATPAWAADAIWYQVFVERFRNGDTSNDPTAHDIIGFTADSAPAGWGTTAWSHDWYQRDTWAMSSNKDFYTAAQFRRYGGDLRGLIDKLDYLQALGVTALYLNPVNDAPSLHKYDARSYHHIDRNFGPDPKGDEALAAREDPVNPATWTWTSADSLFLSLVREVHRRGMRIIMDYSWNHTGITFWAWQDVLKNQALSRFAGWYEIQSFDNPATPDTSEFVYRGWAGVPWLPEWKKVGRPAGQTQGAIEGDLVPGVRDHVFNVTRRWLDPNGDGDPSDGVDGFRLDVAEMVPLGFWRDYRTFVRGINPEAYLVGEIWWEKWPDQLYDPAPWLKGDVFDAVMNYRWFMPTRSFFANAEPRTTASQYVAQLDSLKRGIEAGHQKVMMNLTASHDTPRFSTSVFNRGRYKYHNRPTEDSTYRIDRPDERARRAERMILVQQFTYVGAPHIWNGDEVGMWGADDPDERKPMVWADQRYTDETTHPLGLHRKRDRVRPDTALFQVYRDLAALRKAHLRLFVDGSLNWLRTDDARGVLVYDRVLGDERAVVAFNNSDAPQQIVVPGEGHYRTAYPAGRPITSREGSIRFVLQPRSSRVLIRE